MNKSEAVVQQQVRLALAERHAQVWRNNSGAFQDETGRWIRYGLANDSKKLNENVKSSDLIGGVPVLIGPQHVGRWMAILTAIECKPENWHMIPSDKRACAQANFHTIVKNIGGFAGFATSVDDLNRIIL